MLRFFKFFYLIKKLVILSEKFRISLINYFEALLLLNVEFFLDTLKLTYPYQKNLCFHFKITTGFYIYHNVT